jgi:hypothetical protein
MSIIGAVILVIGLGITAMNHTAFESISKPALPRRLSKLYAALHLFLME